MSEDRKNYVETQIESIQINAKENTLNNGVLKELTHQQALSIYLRSRQLVKESNRETGYSPKEIAKQIDICYRQRQERRSIY